MADAPVVDCLTCHTPVTPADSAVFRDGAKIAHVKCWTPKDLVTPMRQPDQGARSKALAPGPTASGAAAR